MGKHRSLVIAIIGILVMAFMVGIMVKVPAPQATLAVYCGDGSINQVNEQCDGINLGGQTCISKGYTYGVLKCTPSCQFDISGCRPITPVRKCGNGIVEGTEQCDDGNTISGDGCSSTCRVDRVTPRTI